MGCCGYKPTITRWSIDKKDVGSQASDASNRSFLGCCTLSWRSMLDGHHLTPGKEINELYFCPAFPSELKYRLRKSPNLVHNIRILSMTDDLNEIHMLTVIHSTMYVLTRIVERHSMSEFAICDASALFTPSAKAV